MPTGTLITRSIRAIRSGRTSPTPWVTTSRKITATKTKSGSAGTLTKMLSPLSQVVSSQRAWLTDPARKFTPWNEATPRDLLALFSRFTNANPPSPESPVIPPNVCGAKIFHAKTTEFSANCEPTRERLRNSRAIRCQRYVHRRVSLFLRLGSTNG